MRSSAIGRPLATAVAAATVSILWGSSWGCSSSTSPAAPLEDASVAPPTGSADGGDDAQTPSVFRLHASGTRLRAEVNRLGDVRRFQRFFDTLRNEPCAYLATSDGDRCLPLPVPGVIHFEDADCTSPIAVQYACDEPPAYAVRWEADPAACIGPGERIAEIRRVIAPLPPGAAYQREADGTCGRASPIDLQRYRLSEPIRLTEFVAATPATRDASTRIAVEFLVGTDGSEVATGTLVDRQGGGTCAPFRVGPRGGGTARCVPTPYAYSDDQLGPYADNACGEPVGYVPRAACPTPRAVFRAVYGPGPSPGCAREGDVSLFEPGARVENAFAGPSCAPFRAGRATYRLGAPLDPETLAAVPPQTFGSGRLRVQSPSSDGVQLTIGDLWDDVEQAPCSPATFADGTTYCLPSNAVITLNPRFKDADCTQEILVSELCVTAKYLVEHTSNECASPEYGTTVRPLSAPYSLTQSYGRDGEGRCSAAIAHTPNQQVYDLLPPVPASSRFAVLPSERETQ